MSKPMEQIGWRELEPGCVIVDPGNSRSYRTGDWRTGGHPVVDTERCIKCAQCFMFCPDAAFKRNEEGFFLPDLFFCKGCGICAHECPVHCIEMVQEGA